MPSGYDRVRTSDGITCESSISPDSYVEVGFYGQKDEKDNWYNRKTHNYSNDGNDEIGVYTRLVVPLGGPKKRINCNRIYEIQVEKLKYELESLKREKTLREYNESLKDLVWPKTENKKNSMPLLPITDGSYIFKPKNQK